MAWDRGFIDHSLKSTKINYIVCVYIYIYIYVYILYIYIYAYYIYICILYIYILYMHIIHNKMGNPGCVLMNSLEEDDQTVQSSLHICHLCCSISTSMGWVRCCQLVSSKTHSSHPLKIHPERSYPLVN